MNGDVLHLQVNILFHPFTSIFILFLSCYTELVTYLSILTILMNFIPGAITSFSSESFLLFLYLSNRRWKVTCCNIKRTVSSTIFIPLPLHFHFTRFYEIHHISLIGDSIQIIIYNKKKTLRLVFLKLNRPFTVMS